jgi:hypothetical protein
MQETIEFRIPESHAERYLPADAGMRLGITRKLELQRSDPLFAHVGRIERQLSAEGRAFFTAWIPHRRYSRQELAEAELLKISAKKVFEPAGEECGTVYDDAQACPVCGAGAPQLTALLLDGRHMPRGVDFASTIAGEVIVSKRVADLFTSENLRGAEFVPVRLTNEDERPSGEWCQVKALGVQAALHSSTRVGNDPFDHSEAGRCPRCDLAGLNVLSEVSIRRETYDGSDFVETKELTGVRRGLLRPRPVMLLSPRGWRMIDGAKLKGLAVEVAHLL